MGERIVEQRPAHSMTIQPITQSESKTAQTSVTAINSLHSLLLMLVDAHSNDRVAIGVLARTTYLAIRRPTGYLQRSAVRLSSVVVPECPDPRLD